MKVRAQGVRAAHGEGGGRRPRSRRDRLWVGLGPARGRGFRPQRGEEGDYLWIVQIFA